MQYDAGLKDCHSKALEHFRPHVSKGRPLGFRNRHWLFHCLTICGDDSTLLLLRGPDPQPGTEGRDDGDP